MSIAAFSVVEGRKSVEYPTLGNPPLVEAIFELRWKLQDERGARTDPYYRVLIGGVYERLREDYPALEALPAATMPDEIAAYAIQHRFRKAKDEWPLIQIGPGIVTLNYTQQGFKREVFHSGIRGLVQTFLDVYPGGQRPKCDSLMLRYIDAMDFDYEADDISEYISRVFKADIRTQSLVFEGTDVSASPTALDCSFFFACGKPTGELRLRFARGSRDGRDLLTWEIAVQTIRNDVPNSNDEICRWAREADELVHRVFFKMIEGELMERFK